ncbi:MAG: adenylate/guanylate cyclase domain-containing protein [Thermoleophilaceae bacterium]
MSSPPRPSSIDAVASAVDPESLDLTERSSPDGAVTLLFSDIEGSTAIMERIGERRSFEVLRDHTSLVRQLVESFGGSVVKSQGDGFMVSFPSAHAGVHCAIEMQRTFDGHSVPDVGPLKVRIGLHSGYVIADADDFFGRNVVLAARIADRAGGGEILVSSTVKDYTETDPRVEFEARGEFHLKGLVGEHTIYAVRWFDGGATPDPA